MPALQCLVCVIFRPRAFHQQFEGKILTQSAKSRINPCGTVLIPSCVQRLLQVEQGASLVAGDRIRRGNVVQNPAVVWVLEEQFLIGVEGFI